MSGSVLMVQGTTSDAGKSFLTAGLLRLFRRRGLKVAPFKAQNMALNAVVTPDGREIGRAQGEQAKAAGLPPHVDMNPILLKPESGHRSQVVVLGRSRGSMTYRAYQELKHELRPIVLSALHRLRDQFDLVIIEGAGSPAEINLDGDIVNMFIARSARAPVILVTDIDRGGAFASLYGTWSLLAPEDRDLVKGFVMNRIRGDPSLLDSGNRKLLELTGIPVLGAVPYLEEHRVPEEDSLGLDRRRWTPRAHLRDVEVTIVDLPHMSNYDEFQSLERRVTVRYSAAARDGLGTDLVIIPGSKRTIEDLRWIRSSGWSRVLETRHASRKPILGICGGCQMLGRSLHDRSGIETRGDFEGLGLLPLSTVFEPEKRTRPVWVEPVVPPFDRASIQGRLPGYEIHHGRVRLDEDAAPFARVMPQPAGPFRADGAWNDSTIGTMVHGLFEHPASIDSLVQWIHSRSEASPPATSRRPTSEPSAEAHPEPSVAPSGVEGSTLSYPEDPYEALAVVLERALDIPALEHLLSQSTLHPRSRRG
ncbi:MAG: cobyric acid synthase [Myxococcota bacterium]